MKSLGRFCHPLAFGVLTAAFLMASSAEAAVNKAQVRAARGQATYSKDNGQTWVPVRVGNSYTPGTIIKTGDNATVDLFLGDNGPVVRVTPASQLGVDKLDIERGIEPVINTELNLKNGRILGNVKKLAAASKYEVETPVGVAAIRGTEFDINANGSISVISGTVEVQYRDPQTGAPIGNPVTVTAGQTAIPPTAANPQATVGETSAMLPPEVVANIATESGSFRAKVADIVATITVVDNVVTKEPEPVVTGGAGKKSD